MRANGNRAIRGVQCNSGWLRSISDGRWLNRFFATTVAGGETFDTSRERLGRSYWTECRNGTEEEGNNKEIPGGNRVRQLGRRRKERRKLRGRKLRR